MDLRAIVLLYRGLEPVILAAYGEPEGVCAILAAIPCPAEVYMLVPETLGEAVQGLYALQQPHREWRMVLEVTAFQAPACPDVQRILPEQAEALAALYAQAAEPGETVVAFSPAQIAQGRFFGVWQEGVLIAAAGTHIWSPAEDVVAVGNVFTQPAQRGRGLATQCTGAVVAAALAAGVRTVVLNVREDNAPAIRVYERLGFRRYARFIEGPGWRCDARQA